VDPERILLLADVNIGDAINIQPAAEVLRARFPRCRIDYIHSAKAAPLVENNPAIARSIPLFEGRFVPEDPECEAVRARVSSGDYELVLSFCPFLPEGVLDEAPCPTITPIRLVCDIIARACSGNGARAGLAENLAAYVGQIAGACACENDRALETSTFRPRIYLMERSVRRREGWLREQGLSPEARTVFFNPDASNSYTLVPVHDQLELLRCLLASEACEQLLLGSGFTFTGIERRLLEELGPQYRRKATVVPRDLPIDAFAALTDLCEVFLTADTGPMHIAAARKVCCDGSCRFRNRTSVIGLFGPTLPRVYGYDSRRAGYSDANQDAAARVFESSCARKNLMCSLARIAEQCTGRECFEGFDPTEVAGFALKVLGESVLPTPG
jgi:ADP-heptose:LPS heptosyltransferase